MLSFWATVTEKEVENYARTLLLPDYMSHLVMDSFHFADQPFNQGGQEPLVITYSGDGRLEEIHLRPGEHAIRILANLKPPLLPGRIELPRDAVWSWSRENSGVECPTGSSIPVMRVYFSPHPACLEEESACPFPARDAYVSVSRGEIFLSKKVLVAYLGRQCDRVSTTEEEELPHLIPIAGGYRFQQGVIGGELLVAPDRVLDDLLFFARLKRSLGYLADSVSIDWTACPPELSPDGILIRFESPAL